MGRELQKRKRRSSRAKVKMPNRVSKKQLNPTGNSTIAQAWFVPPPPLLPLPSTPSPLPPPPRNQKKPLPQNSPPFGIVPRLGHTAGGIEKKPTPSGAV